MPTHGRAFNNLAVARQAHGDVDGALVAYAAATRLLPDVPTLPLNALRCMLDGARWPLKSGTHTNTAVEISAGCEHSARPPMRAW